MLERKPQINYVPLRVRFRSSTEPSQLERESPSSAIDEASHRTEPLVPDLTELSEAQRRIQQIKELVRLSNLLRGDLGLDEALQQIVASTAVCMNFHILVINLIDEKTQTFLFTASAGLSVEHQHILQQAHDSVALLHKVMRPEFRISQSYFIPHDQNEILADATIVKSMDVDDSQAGGWHPEDILLVPLFSPREQKLLGFLSLDDPQDGKIPTEESIEVAELFAHQAATAIDNARIFQERELERVTLEQGISLLQEDLEQLRRGNLQTGIRATHPKLQPLADAINPTVKEISTLLKSMQMVTQAVDEHVRNVQRNAELLVRDTSQQERQVHQISHVIGEIANMMHYLSERSAILSKTTVDSVEVTREAQSTVDRAVEGMGVVRETTMQSARIMKSLSESGQEINETVVAMTDLTMRMHLLALNAAIEAARSGESGQGFAVVAKEMRSLATHSTEETRKVGSYIRTFQHETAAVSQSVEQSTQQVVMQTELVTQTGVALEAIAAVAERLTHLIKGICTTTQGQERGSQLVVSAVEEILHMTGDITTRMRETQQSMTHLVELTDALRSRLSMLQFGERES